jgi:hypothetical protein
MAISNIILVVVTDNFMKPILLAIFFILLGTQCFSQEKNVVKCKVQDKTVKSAKYYTGVVQRVQETLLIQIGVEPRRVNETDLILIAKHIKERFCKESSLVVMIFDDKKTAKYGFDASFKESRDALRGEYVLNRATGKEYIYFVNTPDYYNTTAKRIRINL